MRILYDGQIYEMQAFGGINRYFAEFISRLPPEAEPTLFSGRKRRTGFPVHSNLRFEDSRLFGPFRLARWTRPYVLRMLLKGSEWDIIHPTYYADLRAYRGWHSPLVITVYDMVYELFPGTFRDDHSRLYKKACIERADHVICISENTKSDLCRFYRVDERRISVIHLASGLPQEEQGGEPERGVEPEAIPYFLFVGARAAQYKNFRVLLEAYSIFSARYPDGPRLVVAGPPCTAAERIFLKGMKIAGRVRFTGVVATQELRTLYRKSTAFVFPSLYEGFGIPLLEAMETGAPVLCSDSSCFPEIAGEAALYFDPDAPEAIADAMGRVWSCPEIRLGLIEKGRERRSLFSWEKTSRATWEVYKRVITKE